jgi:hypothetical protein
MDLLIGFVIGGVVCSSPWIAPKVWAWAQTQWLHLKDKIGGPM